MENIVSFGIKFVNNIIGGGGKEPTEAGSRVISNSIFDVPEEVAYDNNRNMGEKFEDTLEKPQEYENLSAKKQKKILKNNNVDLNEGWETGQLYNQYTGELESAFYTRTNDDGSREWLRAVHNNADGKDYIIHTTVKDGEETGTTEMYEAKS